MNKDKQRELKQTYKEMKLPVGVFQVRNKANGKVFVVSAFNLNGKINGVRFQLNMGSHRSTRLQNDWKEFGEECFEFEILETLDQDKIESSLQKTALKELEKKWLDKLKPFGDTGYN